MENKHYYFVFAVPEGYTAGVTTEDPVNLIIKTYEDHGFMPVLINYKEITLEQYEKLFTASRNLQKQQNAQRSSDDVIKPYA